MGAALMHSRSRNESCALLIDIAKATRTQWSTPAEVVEATGLSHDAACKWLHTMVTFGLLAVRRRERPPGDSRPGYMPAEYALVSAWGGCA